MTQQETMDGSPSVIDRRYIHIEFQRGPLDINDVNGTTIEEVAGVLIARLRGFQRGPFKCDENEQAILAFKDAIGFLEVRTRNRQEQGVEGKNEPHTS